MSWKIRQFTCEDCGKVTLRNRDSNGPWVCKPCGIDRRTLNLPIGGRPAPPPEDPPASCAR